MIRLGKIALLITYCASCSLRSFNIAGVYPYVSSFKPVTNHYQVLGVLPNATSEQIKAAYREHAKHFHPDKHNNSEFFKKRFQDILEAYEILIDDKKRRQFDEQFLKRDKEPLVSKSDILDSSEDITGNQGSLIEQLKNRIWLLFGVLSILLMTVWLLRMGGVHAFSSAPAYINIYHEKVIFEGFFRNEKFKKAEQRADSLIKTGQQIDTSSIATHNHGFEYADLVSWRAVAKHGNGNDTGAIKDYTLSIGMHRYKDAFDYAARAEARIKLGDIRGALTDIESALKIDPQDVLARDLRAGIFFDKKEYDKALIDYRVVYKANPKLIGDMYNAGICLQQLGKADSACIMWRKAGDLGDMDSFERIKENCQ